MDRTKRAFLRSGGSTVVCLALGWRGLWAATRAQKDVLIVEFSDAGVRGKTVRVPKIMKTEAEWRAELSEASYGVTRREETERPFTGAYWNHHQPGLYRCVCCGTALFTSETKFDSGTGWPSFWAPIARENVVEQGDSGGMQGAAVSCRRCDAHLGHVFDDGPRPTGRRYCMNSVALRFAKRA